MKAIIYALIGTLCCSSLFYSCTGERLPVEKEVNGSNIYIVLEIAVPSAITPASRTVSTDNERYIDNLSILVFNEDNTFAYKTEPATYFGGKATVKMDDPTGDEKYGLMVIANMGEIDISGYTPGLTTKEQIRESLIFECNGKWDASTPRYFPMWGETGYKPINRYTDFGTIHMLRSIARIDVGINFTSTLNGIETAGGISGYTLKEVHLYRSRDRGHIIPSAANYSSVEKKVILPTVPGSAGVNAAGTAGTKADGLKYQISSDNLCIRDIYLPENNKVAKDECTAIVAGIEHNNITLYHRMDIDIDSDGDIDPILRNNRYIFNIVSIKSDGFTNPEEALNAVTSNIEYTVTEWDMNWINIYVSGNYYFRVSDHELTLSEYGDTRVMRFETNLPMEQVFYSENGAETTPGEYITYSLTPDEPVVGSDIVKGAITYSAPINHSGNEIIHTGTISAGDINLKVTVRQQAFRFDYQIECSSIKVSGRYMVDTRPTLENHIELTLTNTSGMAGMRYEVETDTIAGLSFRGEGIFIDKDFHRITLYADLTLVDSHNNPALLTPSGVKTLTFRTNSIVPTSCSVNIMVGYSRKTILGVSSEGGIRFGYAAEKSASRAFLMNPNNFGPNGSVPVESIELIYPSPPLENPSTSFLTLLATNPDIILTGYATFFTDPYVHAKLLEYVNNGGVLIMFDHYPYDNINFLKAIFESNVSFYGWVGSGGNVDAILGSVPDTDPILSGVLDGKSPAFGSIKGFRWGYDSSGSGAITISSGDQKNFVVYSTRSSGTTFVRYKNKNIVWNGHGGFLANPETAGGPYIGPSYNGNSSTVAPFAIDAQHRPITRNYSGGTVENSRIFANIMAWAIHQAEFYGINSGGLPPPIVQ